MGRGFGIAALVFAIVSIFIPILGILLAWLALGLATIAAVSGDKTFAIAVSVLSGADFLFLRPSLWLSALSPNDSNFIEISIVMVFLPISAVILRAFLVRKK